MTVDPGVRPVEAERGAVLPAARPGRVRERARVAVAGGVGGGRAAACVERSTRPRARRAELAATVAFTSLEARRDVAGGVLRGDLVVVGAGGEPAVRVGRTGRLRDPVGGAGREAGSRRAVDVVARDADVVGRRVPAQVDAVPGGRAPPARRAPSAASCPRSRTRSPRSRPGRGSRRASSAITR